MAGSESVTKFIHNSWIASNGDFIPNTNPKNIVTISPILVEIKKCIAFFILSYMFLPCFTASTIVTNYHLANHICCIFCHVCTTFSHCNSYVCILQCRSIIHTISSHCNYCTCTLKSLHNSYLMFW